MYKDQIHPNSYNFFNNLYAKMQEMMTLLIFCILRIFSVRDLIN